MIPIAICGAGPVGQALALLLHQRGIPAKDIVLFDAKTREQAAQDRRTIALSYGSQQILERIQASVTKVTAIQEIHVSRRAYFGRSLIKASEYQLPALGYVARYGDIITPLEIAIENAGICIQRPLRVVQQIESADHVELHLDNGAIQHCQILIQAEGGTFDDQAVGAQHHDYQQTAIISHVICSQANLQRAFERFTEEGPLALLPQEDGYSLVWCVRTETANKLMTLSDDAFLQALQTAFGNRVGQFLNASKRSTYALGLNTYPSSKKRCINIGNAAQSLHPVAGQGLNLGLRDAYVLAQCLSKQTLNDTNQIQQALSTFQQKRHIDRTASIRITDSMARVFSKGDETTINSIKQTTLGFGLGILDLHQPAKKILAEQMMFGYRE
jgi:2-octaprenyl-6-methoxyphenol hydroxylase